MPRVRAHRGLLITGLILVSASSRPLAAETSWSSPRIASDQQVQAAFAWIDAHRAEQVREWIHITEIPAPSRLEDNRARYIEAELRAVGLDSVRRDSIGNLIAVLKGPAGSPGVAFASHLDTVVP